jgi:hypothetical protein
LTGSDRTVDVSTAVRAFIPRLATINAHDDERLAWPCVGPAIDSDLDGL